MPANDDRHGPTPRRTLIKTITIAAAVAGALALAACSSSATSAPVPVTAATGSGTGSPGTLTGAGSTYVAPFLTLALARYHQQHPAVTVTYSAVGSSAGIAAISARQVNFGASDVPMNASELAAAKGGPVTQVPDALGAEGIAYHLRPPRRRPAAPDRPGPRGDLPRPGHPLERPGHHRPQPGPQPPGRADHRRAPLRRQRHHLHLQQLPVQRQPRLGQGSAPARRSAGQSEKAPRATTA